MERTWTASFTSFYVFCKKHAHLLACLPVLDLPRFVWHVASSYTSIWLSNLLECWWSNTRQEQFEHVSSYGTHRIRLQFVTVDNQNADKYYVSYSAVSILRNIEASFDLLVIHRRLLTLRRNHIPTTWWWHLLILISASQILCRPSCIMLMAVSNLRWFQQSAFMSTFLACGWLSRTRLPVTKRKIHVKLWAGKNAWHYISQFH